MHLSKPASPTLSSSHGLTHSHWRWGPVGPLGAGSLSLGECPAVLGSSSALGDFLPVSQCAAAGWEPGARPEWAWRWFQPQFTLVFMKRDFLCCVGFAVLFSCFRRYFCLASNIFWGSIPVCGKRANSNLDLYLCGMACPGRLAPCGIACPGSLAPFCFPLWLLSLQPSGQQGWSLTFAMTFCLKISELAK